MVALSLGSNDGDKLGDCGGTLILSNWVAITTVLAAPPAPFLVQEKVPASFVLLKTFQLS